MRRTPIIITIPPFMNEEGEPQEFWAWAMIVLLLVLYLVFEL